MKDSNEPNQRTKVRAIIAASAFAAMMMTGSVAAAQQCAGNCNGDRQVTVDEVLSCVSIGLGGSATEECPECDLDLNGQVTVDEIIRSVNAALGLETTTVVVVCSIPGISGLVPCPDGTTVQIAVCNDAAECLSSEAGRQNLLTANLDGSGASANELQSCSIANSLLLAAAEPETGMTLRGTLDLGGAAAPQARTSNADGVIEIVLSPVSEAATRLLDEVGLENLELETASAAVDAVFAANATTDFAGLSLANAVDRATDVARADATVQELLFSNAAIAIEIHPNPAMPGETVSVTVVATNRSQAPLENVTLRMELPDGMENVNTELILRSSGAPTCDGNGNRPNRCDSLETLTLSLGTLPAGAGASLTLPTTFAAAPTSSTNFPASIESDGRTLASATASVRFEDQRDLSLALESDRDPTAPGDRIRYRLSYGNRSTDTVTADVNLSLQIPDGTTFLTASDGGSYHPATGAVVWTIGDVPNATTGVREVEVRVDEDLSDGTILHAMAAIQDGIDPPTRAMDLVRVVASPAVQFSMEWNPDPAMPGDVVTGNLTVTNISENRLLEVVAQLQIPDFIQELHRNRVGGASIDCPRGQAGDGTCIPTERLIWTIGTMEVGQSAHLSIPPTLHSSVPSGEAIVFRAIAADSAGNLARTREAIRIEAAPVLSLSLDEDLDPVVPGEVLAYRLSFANLEPGSTPTLDTRLRVRIPEGSEFASASDNGTFDPSAGIITWELGNLFPGDTGVREFSVDIDADVNAGTVLEAAAWIDDTDGRRTRATADTTIDLAASLLLTLEVIPSAGVPGNMLDATLTATNLGEIPVFEVIAEVLLPVGLNPRFTASDTSSPDAVTCPLGQGSGGSNTCQQNERMIWDIGRIDPDESVTLEFPPAFEDNPAGVLRSFNAFVTDPQGTSARVRTTVRLRNP